MEEIKTSPGRPFQLSATPEECPFLEDIKLMSALGEVEAHPYTYIISQENPSEEVTVSKFCPGIWPVFLWGKGETPVRLHAVNEADRCTIYDTIIPPPLLLSGVILKPTKQIQKLSFSFWEPPKEKDLAILFLWIIAPR